MNMGLETLSFNNISKHASHFKMDSNTHTHTHTQTHIVYYYYYHHHYVFPLLNPSQLPIEISDFNGNKAFPDPCSYNIISSSKCEECVLKFVPYLFVTPGIWWLHFIPGREQLWLGQGHRNTILTLSHWAIQPQVLFHARISLYISAQSPRLTIQL